MHIGSHRFLFYRYGDIGSSETERFFHLSCQVFNESIDFFSEERISLIEKLYDKLAQFSAEGVNDGDYLYLNRIISYMWDGQVFVTAIRWSWQKPYGSR